MMILKSTNLQTSPNHNRAIAFRQSWGRSPGGAFGRPNGTTILGVVLAFLLAAALSMALVTGAADGPHAGWPERAVAPSPEQYGLAGVAWQIPDLSAPFPEYAFAQLQSDALVTTAPPTFVSSELDISTGVLSITFSEAIDASRVVASKIHVRESGNYTHGVTLAAAELDTRADGATISFTLSATHHGAVVELTSPELTIDPGAVRDTRGNPIVSTFDTSDVRYVHSILVRLENSTPKDVEFSSDGTKMFTVDYLQQRVNEYIVGRPFDLTGVHGFLGSFSVASDMEPFTMAFSNDGTKMFVTGITGDHEQESILSGNPGIIDPAGSNKSWSTCEYALSDAFDVSNASRVDCISVFEPGGFTLLTGMAFSNDGTKMFIAGAFTKSIYTYTLSTPFDLSTASHADTTLITVPRIDLRDIAFSSDGTKMFLVDDRGSNIHKHTLSTPFDASTARYDSSFTTSSHETSPYGVALSNDGSQMFIVGTHQKTVVQYALNSVYPVTVTSSVVPEEDSFVTTWKTTSDAQSITIPATGTYTIDWGDGTTDKFVSGTQTHTYADPGNHTVSITGDPRNMALGSDNAAKLLSIDQWGSIKWNLMQAAFRDASSVVYNATDAPDLSRVTNMVSMFLRAASFDGDLSSWNVSHATHMRKMFHGATSFDGNISGWDVSSVTDMSEMFRGATSFDGDLSAWNISSVTDMSEMFHGATSFDGNISGWDVSSVTDMSEMFSGTTSFNQNLGSWYVVANATSIERNSVPSVVAEITAQNTQLDGHDPTYGKGAGGDWDYFDITGDDGNLLRMTSAGSKGTYHVNVTASGPSVFSNGNNWHTVVVTVLGSIPPVPVLTADAVIFTGNDPLTVSVDFGKAIDAATFAVSDISVTGGDASDLTHLSGNRTFAFTITPDAVGQVDVSIPAGSITDLAGNANAVSDTLQMTFAPDEWFATTWRTDGDGEAITLPLRGTDIVIQWGDGSVSTDISETATHAYADAGTYGVLISGGLEQIILNNMASAPNLVSIDQWGSTQWTSMKDAFKGASNMVYRATDVPDLSGVQDMSGMFKDASSFNGTIGSWNVSQATDMNNMFNRATAFNQPLNDWDVSQVTDMRWMFHEAAAFNQPLNDWDVSQVTDMNNMFNTAAAFNQPLNDWNVSQVTLMFRMFSGATAFNQPLNDWDVSQATRIFRMFSGATLFDQNLGNWYVVANATSVASEDVPGVVAELSAQNTRLDGQLPEYGIGEGGDSDLFEIVNGNELSMNSVKEKSLYGVNVTASGSPLYGDGNWRVLEIRVTGLASAAPSVDAGGNQTVVEGDTVILSGTATDENPEDGLTYSWSHDSTLPITLSSTAVLSPSFDAPNVSGETAVVFTLTVSDGAASATDSVVITITDSANSSPSVDAGSDQEATEGSTVTLSGTAADADSEDGLTYSWSHDSRLPITLSNAAVLSPSFDAPNISEDTAIEFTLTVSDGTVRVEDSVVITITDSANSSPSVDAGSDQEATEGSTVTLSGTAADADPEDGLTYSWSHDSRLAIALDGSASLDASFTAPNVSGETAVVFTLTVSDGAASATDSVVITITDSANSSPSVDAGSDQEATEGSTVTLSGTAADADPEDGLTYSWSHDSRLPITLSNAAVLSPSFDAPNISEDTAIEFTLTVSDGAASATDSVVITITDSANAAPSVDAGSDQEATEGSTVTLSGTAADTDPEDGLTYSWSHDSRLPITLSNAAVLSPSFDAPNISEDTAIEFTLTVSDGHRTGRGQRGHHHNRQRQLLPVSRRRIRPGGNRGLHGNTERHRRRRGPGGRPDVLVVARLEAANNA